MNKLKKIFFNSKQISPERINQLNQFCKTNHIKFSDIELLDLAFHHRSYSNENTKHKSLVGNSFVYAFDLCQNEETKQKILEMLDENGIDTLSLFCTFPILMGLAKDGDEARIKEALLHDGAWKRMLKEEATTTFEGWGKETKWNTSLFHLTMSYAALFMTDIDLKKLFE